MVQLSACSVAYRSTMLFIVGCMLAHAAMGRRRVEIFVSPNATRTGTGTATSPFDLSAAQNAVRKMFSDWNCGLDLMVTLMPGTYFDTSLVFDRRDSPPNCSSVTWRGASGVPVGTTATVLYGGPRITGWSHYTKNIWQAPLPVQLTDDKGRAVFHTLVQGDRSAWLARTPDYGSGFLPCRGNNAGSGGTMSHA